MNDARTVLLDACVLIPMPLADTLLRLGSAEGLYLPKWSDQIMTEVGRTLQQKFGLSREKTLHREAEIRRHFPEAWVEKYQHLIPAMTNHAKDRHVLAAAAHARASIIVTYNAKDFPVSSLVPHFITAQGPSTFLKSLHGIAPSIVMRTLEAQAAAINQPLPYLLSRLRINVPAFVAMLDEESKQSCEPNCA